MRTCSSNKYPPPSGSQRTNPLPAGGHSSYSLVFARRIASPSGGGGNSLLGVKEPLDFVALHFLAGLAVVPFAQADLAAPASPDDGRPVHFERFAVAAKPHREEELAQHPFAAGVQE